MSRTPLTGRPFVELGAVLLALVGLVLFWSYAARPTASGGSRVMSAGEASGGDPAGVVPGRVTVSRVRLSTPVTTSGLQIRGSLLVPYDPGVLGWYTASSTPGSATGSTVLAGHLDGHGAGRSAVVRFGRIRRGDVVVVHGQGNEVLRYRVQSTRRYDDRSLPLARIFDATGPGRLMLVTCWGRFRGPGLGYEKNLVISATPVP